MDIISNKNNAFSTKFYSSNDEFIQITNINREILNNDFLENQPIENHNQFKIDKKNKDNIKGSIYTILSTIFLTFIVIIHKYIFINNFHISATIQIFYKYCGYISFSLIILKVQNYELKSSNEFIKKNLKSFLIRMIAGTLAGTFFILSVLYFNSTIVGIANCIIPILTTILASVLIEDQKFLKREIIILIILFISSYFIIVADSQINNEEKNTDLSSSFKDFLIGILVIFIFIISSTLRAVYSKILYQINLVYQLFFIGIFTVIPYFFICQIIGFSLIQNIPFSHILISYSIGLFEFCPIFLNLYALNIGDIPLLMQLNYLYLPILSILSYLILGESMEIIKVIFIIVIFGVTFGNSYYTNFIEKK